MNKNKLITNRLPILGNDLTPLWRNNLNKVVQAKGWPKKDFSSLDWAAEYVDTGSDKKPFTRKPPDLYGVRGGACIIIDIDAKGDPKKAQILLDDLHARGLDIDTFTVKTKSHGLHLYYLAPSYEVKTVAGWAPSVDIRGKGGYVVGPDMTLSEWTEGTYVVVNDVEPIDCTLELPRAGSKELSALPVIDTSNNVISITALLEQRAQGEHIQLGMRDEALLRISHWCVAKELSDEDIATEFSLFKFESALGDEITLDMLMAKIERDRVTNLDVLTEALRRFVYVKENQTFYDIRDKVSIATPAKMKLHFPEKIMGVNKDNNPTSMSVIDIWTSHPDRIEVLGHGYKPTSEVLFTEDSGLKVNSYKPSMVTPWDEPVTWDEPYLSEYRLMIENLCNYDDRTVNLLLSARAAKVQDLLWTPRWGFIIVSDKMRLGKDFQANIFSRLLARGTTGLTEPSMGELAEGRDNYYNDKIMIVVNEPGAMKANQGASEGVKKLFSETSVSTRKMNQERGDNFRTYRIPEMHTNFAHILDLSRSNKRYAPIMCKQNALPVEVYQTIGNKLEQGDNCKFLRMLKRLFLDWEIHKDINESSAPKMSDGEVAEEESKGMNYVEITQCIEDKDAIFISDIQTRQSIILAIKIYLELHNNEATRLFRQLETNGAVIELCRVRNVPQLVYDDTHIHYEEKLELHRASGMKSYFTIRNHNKHQMSILDEGNQEYIDKHFFTYVKRSKL